jgi:formylglycine-generating enzyme required for sulfatase activity
MLLMVVLVLFHLPVHLQAQPFDVDRIRRSVVRVIADRGNSIGSGAIIKVEGRTAYVLTAYHVIERDVQNGVSHVQVELLSEEMLEARISHRRIDTANDIAVLTIAKLPSPPPPAIPWGASSALRETQRVYALGHPRGSPGWAVTDGTISRILGGKLYFSGTAVSPGNSGGPLLNAQGELVGMNLELGGGLGSALQSDLLRVFVRGWVRGLPETVAETPLPPPKQAEPRMPQTLRGKDGKEMVLVPEGWFEMGSTAAEIDAASRLGKTYDPGTTTSWFATEAPVHRAWVDGFYMDRYEVTVGEYEEFRRATGHRALPVWVSRYAPGDRHPVVGVNWDDATAYCRWAGKQLPTEAQWEKAARGTDRRQYPWGNEPPDGTRANYCDSTCDLSWKDIRAHDRYQYTAPVGSYEKGVSPYGIYDLAGNVCEWVHDWYAADYYRQSLERNPVNTIAADFRVLRGGCWSNNPAAVRAANRSKAGPVVNRSEFVGFRCVMAVSASGR